ncbi:unnamed protein product [Brassica oleracea var. botrytis]
MLGPSCLHLSRFIGSSKICFRSPNNGGSEIPIDAL